LFDRPEAGERAVLVRVGLGSPLSEQDLREFEALAISAGAVPVGTVTGSRRTPEPRYFVGSGKAEEIRDRAEESGAELVLVDHPLSPSQERNLEKLTGRRVLDRAGLILDIFAQRARSAEGKLEVELAQLRHLSTRLVRGWTHLERQKGGIGLRGPGETQLETDRRLLAKRIRTLSQRLEDLARQRDTGRAVRKRVPVPAVALVGYTNAGKSTLFNALTGSEAYAADQLFATLDPTVRRLRLPHAPEIVLADTVGFIRELPHELVAAFRSTLLEARDADLLLHVIDSADPAHDEQVGQVEEVLEGIGAGGIPVVRVYNKVDATGEAPRVERDAEGQVTRVHLSARSGAGLDLLRQCLQERFGHLAERFDLSLQPAEGRLRAALYAAGLVRAEGSLPDGSVQLTLEASRAELDSLFARLGSSRCAQLMPCLPPARFVESRAAAASDAA
jgi:GTP-binding protein HflX